MKRQIFILMVLVLSMGAALMAQTNTQTTPPSQQVDQSGKPEHTGRPDVDVDVGKNAKNGVLNVDAKRHGDADTKAGNNPNGNRMGTTTATGTTASGATTTTTHHRTSRTHYRKTAHHKSSRAHRLPKTGSDMPLAGLLGALALAGALGLRSVR